MSEVLEVEVTPRAAAQIERAAAWWAENRPAAPDASASTFRKPSHFSRVSRVWAPSHPPRGHFQMTVRSCRGELGPAEISATNRRVIRQRALLSGTARRIFLVHSEDFVTVALVIVRCKRVPSNFDSIATIPQVFGQPVVAALYIIESARTVSAAHIPSGIIAGSIPGTKWAFPKL